MSKFWTASRIRSGQQCIELHRWTSFRRLLSSRRLDESGRVWRGQAGHGHDWELKPSILRYPHSAESGGDSNHRLESQLVAFKSLLANRLGPSWNSSDPDEIWAFGQHHGLATPLLDWTISPYVAAFFAYSDKPSDRQPAVFALCRDIVESEQCEVLARRKEEKERLEWENRARLENTANQRELHSVFLGGFADLLDFELRWESTPLVEFILPSRTLTHRFVSQASLFTRLSGCTSVEEWVGCTFVGRNRGAVLTKVVLPAGDREEALRELNSMNVNHLTLFPDVEGVAKYCNLAQVVPGYDRRYLSGGSTSESDRG